MLSNLQAIVKRPKKRVGRGHGTGKVKTAGRGQKGQNARGKANIIGFEGGQLSLIKRLPFLRGKGRNASQKTKAFGLSVSQLNELPAGTTVTLATLVKYHMIHTGVTRVKLLGGEGLKQKLKVAVPCSQSAREAIEKAGGSVEA
jgi:large subunit ribosomal protein L15